MSGGKLKYIDSDSIKKICSGQVIVDLATAIKELVENSLDAGATSIEIRLKEMGVDSIEVSDNGTGIEEENYASIGLKHFTSKLQQFSDLESLESFGFRGEALNALCEVSQSVTVITKQASQAVGSLLTFNRDGSLQSRRAMARQTGTTVTVEKLFEALPVRRGEFVRSIKKHYQKLLRILQGYALIAVGARINVLNVTKTGVQSVLSTQASSKLSDNICSVFGSKFLLTLSSVTFSLSPSSDSSDDSAPGAEVDSTDTKATEESAALQGTGEEGDASQSISLTPSPAPSVVLSGSSAGTGGSAAATESVLGTVTGYVSKVGEGVGRSDNDRQFLFCNGRPVDMPRIAKVINEVWRKYEMKHKPAYILNIILPTKSYDINLAPDKREIALGGEAALMDCLREELDRLYAPSRSTFPLSQGMKPGYFSSLTQASDSGSSSQNDNSFAQSQSPSQLEPFSAVGELSSQTPASTIVQEGFTDNEISPSAPRSDYDSISSAALKGSFVASSSYSPATTTSTPATTPSTTTATPSSQQVKSSFAFGSSQSARPGLVWATATERSGLMASPSTIKMHRSLSPCSSDKSPKRQRTSASATATATADQSHIISLVDDMDEIDDATAGKQTDRGVEASDVEHGPAPHKTISLPVDVEATLQRVGKLRAYSHKKRKSAVKSVDSVSRGNARTLTKQDFLRMRVIGQFNLGFIIAEIDGDLYILDQHACDEKFRFELLQQSTTLHRQPLLRPMAVETTAAEEVVIAENMSVFEENGFKITVDFDEEPGKRVKLHAVPFSKSVQFGKEDVLELASMLDDSINDSMYVSKLVLKNDPISKVKPTSSQQQTASGDGQEVVTKDQLSSDAVGNPMEDSLEPKAASQTLSQRPSKTSGIRLPKLISMFASRACRSAVMIGTALHTSDMEGIIARLADIEQPWNCPHGRPTLRHIFDLASWYKSTAQQSRLQEYVSAPSEDLMSM